MHVAKLLSVLALGVGLFAAPVASQADTYTLSNCANGCGNGNNFGTITTTNIAGGVEVSVVLASGVVFIGNMEPTIMFNLNNSNSITFGGTYNTGVGITPWTPAPGGTQAAGTLNPDGIGTYNHGLDSTGANGANGILQNFVTFDVLQTGLTTASFIAGTNLPAGVLGPLFFAVDLGVGCTGTAPNRSCASTQEVGATLNPVPLPPAALLFGTALAGLGILGRRRRKAVAQA